MQKKHPSETDARAPQRWIRRVFEKSPALVYITDEEGVFLDMNAPGVTMLGGRSREEFIGKVSINSFYVSASDRKRFRKLVADQGGVQECETRFCRMNKKVFDVRVTESACRNARGGIVGYEGCILDITERKLAEQALKESEEKYRTVVESSLSAILVHQGGQVQFTNQRCAEMLGYKSSEELIGVEFWRHVHPADRAVVKERGTMRERAQFTPEQYTFRYIDKNGKMTWAEIRATHAMYMGKPAAVVNFIDITKSKKAEEEIRQLSRRLVKIREEERRILAANLHDEMGQILTAMRFNLDYLLKTLPVRYAEQRRRSEALVHSVERLVNIARDNTSYLRPEFNDQIVLLPALMRRVEEFRVNQPGIHVDFSTLGFKKRLRPEIELAIYRIVQEGLTNIAKHARATAVEVILTYSHPQVMLTIRDNGAGLSAPENEKKSRRKDGIGLVAMKERILSLGGSFEVSSEQGKGTAIRVEIPV